MTSGVLNWRENEHFFASVNNFIYLLIPHLMFKYKKPFFAIISTSISSIVVRNKERMKIEREKERKRTFLMHIHVQVSLWKNTFDGETGVHGCEPPRDSPIKQASVIHTDSDAKRKIDETNFGYNFFSLQQANCCWRAYVLRESWTSEKPLTIHKKKHFSYIL